MSTITSINETTFKGANSVWGSYEGYSITLADGSIIQMGIASGQCCCENYGYLTSQDGLTDFIGAEFISVAVTDAELKHYDVESVYDGSAMFINVETSRGCLQFVAYNEHNGYYSHDAVLVENGTTTHSESL